MKVYDAHVHTGIDYFYYNLRGLKEFDFPLKKLIGLMHKNRVGKSIVTWCPSVKEITCCSPTDLSRRGNKIVSQCPKCNKIVATLEHDPYRGYNVALIDEIRKRDLDA